MPLHGLGYADRSTRVSGIHTSSRMQRIWERAKSAASKFMVGATLITSCGVINACTSYDTSVTRPKETKGKISKTDSEGIVSVELNRASYSLRLVDSETQAPISGVLVVFFPNGSEAAYLVLDPKGVYAPFLGFTSQVGHSTIEDGLAKGALTSFDSNIALYKKEGQLTPLTCSVFPLYGHTSEEMNNLKDVVSSNHFKIVSSSVPLSDLDNFLKLLAKQMIGEAAGNTAEKVSINILSQVIPKAAAKNYVKSIFTALALIDVVATSEEVCWAKYYRGLCYDDNDKFEVWKLLGWDGLNIELDKLPFGIGKEWNIAIATNPFLLVLPSDKNDSNWVPPVATINGDVHVTSGKGLGTIVSLKHVDGKLPTLAIATSTSDTANGGFTFAASACQNYNPTYELEAGNVFMKSFQHAKTTLKVSKDESYSVAFALDDKCNQTNKLYQTTNADKDADKYGNKFKLRVSCEPLVGHVDNNKDCNDNDVVVNPAAKEVCSDGKDNNCDGKTDELCTRQSTGLPSNCSILYTPPSEKTPHISGFNFNDKLMAVLRKDSIFTIDMATAAQTVLPIDPTQVVHGVSSSNLLGIWGNNVIIFDNDPTKFSVTPSKIFVYTQGNEVTQMR